MSTSLFAAQSPRPFHLSVHQMHNWSWDSSTSAPTNTPHLQTVPDEPIAGPWRRIIIFFPDKVVPTIQWARDYHAAAWGGMSIQYHGRYADFLARTSPQMDAVAGVPHLDQSSHGRALINQGPLGHALVLTTLDPYPGTYEKTVNRGILALSRPGHQNLLYGPVCILSFGGTAFPGALRHVTAHDFRRAVDYLCHHPTTPCVINEPSNKRPRNTIVPTTPALKYMGCMDLTLACEADDRIDDRSSLRVQEVAVSVPKANQRQWPSAIAFYIGLRWYVREVIGHADGCGVGEVRWLLPALVVTRAGELEVRQMSHHGTLLVFSADGQPVRDVDVKLMSGYYRGQAGDAERMSTAFTNWSEIRTDCVFSEARYYGHADVVEDSLWMMELVADETEKGLLLGKIDKATKGTMAGY